MIAILAGVDMSESVGGEVAAEMLAVGALMVEKEVVRAGRFVELAVDAVGAAYVEVEVVDAVELEDAASLYIVPKTRKVFGSFSQTAHVWGLLGRTSNLPAPLSQHSDP